MYRPSSVRYEVEENKKNPTPHAGIPSPPHHLSGETRKMGPLLGRNVSSKLGNPNRPQTMQPKSPRHERIFVVVHVSSPVKFFHRREVFPARHLREVRPLRNTQKKKNTGAETSRGQTEALLREGTGPATRRENRELSTQR